MTIGLSETAATINAALPAYLAGAGLAVLPCAQPAPADPFPRILDVSEAAAARPHDVVVDFSDDFPRLTLATDRSPAAIRFGFDDMAFGHALIAELVRPARRPAAGEPASARLLALAARIAASDATVLVLGETGTGKEGVARFIHHSSPRADAAFVAVNCAALPEAMLEAMLFGHRKGSFTGASQDGEGLFRAADRGTLLLDEIAELPLPLQAKLLRALQEREILPVGAVGAEPVDVRVIACANRDLAAEVAAGRFRADLYWRLNVLQLNLAPLSERRLDIRAIAAALIVRHTPPGGAIAWPTAAALDRLLAHRWPGNARELDNVLQRALLLRDGDRIEAGDLSIDAVAPALADGAAPLTLAARTAEATVIRAALDATGGHRLRAAARLGISERTLRYRLADMRAAAA